MALTGKILIVDDELGPRESLRMILKPLYETHTAANGLEALEFLRREKVDLVTLDLKMPGIPGIEVLREIKSGNRDVEVIIVTGFGTLSNAVEAIRYGAVEFVSKPFNVAEIISIVGKSLERRSWNQRIKNLLQRVEDLQPERGAGEGAVGPRETLGRELKDTLSHLDEMPLPGAVVQSFDFLKMLISILESKEPYTSGHSERVSFYSDLIASDLPLPPRNREELKIATLLHDIGKIGFGQRVVKRISLSHNDFSDIRQHPVKSVYLIEPLGLSSGITSAIRHHHERWDGKGYPDGISGESIPLLARIIAVADSYDAMTSDRPYRPGLSPRRVREEMERNAGMQFDPHLIGLFTKRHFEEEKGPGPRLRSRGFSAGTV